MHTPALRRMYTCAHRERMLIFTQNKKIAGHKHTCEPANAESLLTLQATLPGRGPGVAGGERLLFSS